MMKLNSIYLNSSIPNKNRNKRTINRTNFSNKLLKNLSMDSYFDKKIIPINFTSVVKRYMINAIKKKVKEINKIENSNNYNISLPILDVPKNIDHPKTKVQKSFEAFKKVPTYQQKYFKAKNLKKRISSNIEKYQQEDLKWLMVRNYNPKEIEISNTKESELNKLTTLQKQNKSEDKDKIKIFKIKLKNPEECGNEIKESEDDDDIKLSLYNFIKNRAQKFVERKKNYEDKSIQVVSKRNINISLKNNNNNSFKKVKNYIQRKNLIFNHKSQLFHNKILNIKLKRYEK